jgi:CcdB protein
MVKQYDVFKVRGSGRNERIDYVIVLQSDVFRDLGTAIVAPIVKVARGDSLSRVNIPVLIEREEFHIMMPEMGAFRIKQFGTFVVNIKDIHTQVMSAIDLMFAGF